MMNTNRADIVVIDDGINPDFYRIGEIQFNIEVGCDSNIADETCRKSLFPSHGTICAAIIKKYAEDASIGSIKILNQKSRTGEKYRLIESIKWCMENKIKIINLSLGTTDFRDFAEIQNCVNEAASKGVIIIAAGSNRSTYTVPACLTNVIGVRCRKIYKNDQYSFNIYPFDGIDISASGRHYLTEICGNKDFTKPSNSFAAPLISAKVYKIINEYPNISLEKVKQKLFEMTANKKKEKYNPYFCMNMDWNNNSNNSRIFLPSTTNKFWDKKLYIKSLNCINIKSKDLDIPVIAIFGDKDIDDKIHDIYMQFYNNGYYFISVSTDYKDVLKGYEYLPDSIPVGKILQLIYNKYNCDAILLKLNSDSKIKEIEGSIWIDLKVHIYDNKYIFTYFSQGQYKKISLNEEAGINNPEKIFHEIMQCFEGG